MLLPTHAWGEPTASRRALLIHGLSSSGATWAPVGEHLAERGWFATAVDLRGHGDAPRAERYGVDDYVSDLPGTNWDVAIGHSLGGAVAAVAALRAGFARRLVLIDPALVVPDSEWEQVRRDQLSELDLTEESLHHTQPLWSERDIRLKLDASAKATAGMIEGTLDDNHPWNVLARVAEIAIPTLVITGDPAVYTMVPPTVADGLQRQNPLIDYRVVVGTGHSPHRDDFDSTIALIDEWLG